MDASIGTANDGFEVKPTLFVEFHGTDAYVGEQIELMKSDHRRASAPAITASPTKPEDRSRRWKARPTTLTGRG